MTYPGYSDLPTTNDELGFGPTVQALTTIISTSNLDDTPLTIGIYGPWGTGKTSLMQMISSRLSDAQVHPTLLPIWFDAWRYAQNDALWRALLVKVVEEIRAHVVNDTNRLRTLLTRRAQQKGITAPIDLSAERAALEEKLDDLIASLYRTVEREELGGFSINWPELGKSAAGTVVRLGLAAIPFVGTVHKALEEAVKSAQGSLGEGADVGAFAKALRRERSKIYRDQIISLEQFYTNLKDLTEEWASVAGYQLVIFIDDLDRCLPEQAISVLEAIKVFFDARGCIFIIGVDREIIEHGIRIHYKKYTLDTTGDMTYSIAERDYLEKIVQIPFTIPPLAPNSIRSFLESRISTLVDLTTDDRHKVVELMTVGLLRNPRKVKRAFNIFRLHISLDRAYGRKTEAGLIAKLTVIQSSFTEIYDRIVMKPSDLYKIEAIVRGTPNSNAVPEELRKEVGKQDPRMRELLYGAPFFENLAPEELQELVYQSRISNETSIESTGLSDFPE